jgi:hypothetical protein
MIDSSLDWKIECLRTIQTMPHGSSFEIGKTSRHDLIWILDLEREGYISAKFRMGYYEEGDKFADSSIPNLIWNVHVVEKGSQLIADFESKRTFQGFWSKHYLKIGGLLVTIIIGLIIAYLTHAYSIFH